MAAENKRYYWLKLPDGFFGQKEIKLLRQIAGGDTYTVIYLKMLLKSLSNNGVLYFDGIADDFIAELALDIDEKEENVAITVQYLTQKNILVSLSEEEFLLTTCAEMVGSETASTRRSRKSRELQKLLQCNIIATNCNGEIEKEIDIETDTDIEKEGKKENTDSDESVPPPSPDVKGKKGKKSKKPKAPEPEKKAYGEFQNVFLTDDELEKLKSKYSDYQERIEKLSAGIESKGYKYKSHYATIISWANSDSKKSGRKEPEPKWMTKSAGNYNSYSQRQYSTEELDELEAKLTGVKTAGTDPEIAARAEALQERLKG